MSVFIFFTFAFYRLGSCLGHGLLKQAAQSLYKRVLRLGVSLSVRIARRVLQCLLVVFKRGLGLGEPEGWRGGGGFLTFQRKSDRLFELSLVHAPPGLLQCRRAPSRPASSAVLSAFAEDTTPAAKAVQELLKDFSKESCEKFLAELPKLVPDDPVTATVLADAMADAMADELAGDVVEAAASEQPRGRKATAK